MIRNVNMDQLALLLPEKNPDTKSVPIKKEDANSNVLRRHIQNDPRKIALARHRLWMDAIQHEYPMPYTPYRIGVYIRYYNQTKYANYLEKHILQYKDDISLCPVWELVDFYIDKGMTAPHMENSREWCRLLADCFSGRINLIVTQKVSNVSSNPDEITFIAGILAAQKPAVGIYFVSEDIFTLASYYRNDLYAQNILPDGWEVLPKDEFDVPMGLCPSQIQLPDQISSDSDGFPVEDREENND